MAAVGVKHELKSAPAPAPVLIKHEHDRKSPVPPHAVKQEKKLARTYSRWQDIKLKDYQIEGRNFLINAHTKLHGAILADPMGAGKTFQALGAMFSILDTTPGTPPHDTTRHARRVYTPYSIAQACG